VIRRRILVGGRVQGVFYRDTARQTARRHGVSGWVRNLADGTVEAVFEGEPAGVDALIAFCERGPAGAVVERVEVFEETPEGLTGFRIA
jgi:acylphosphatase